MEEPSVLDYVKSKLAFWKQSTLEIPELPAVAAPAENGKELLTVERAHAPVHAGRLFRFPWLTLAPLALALVAQTLLEPPNRRVMEAVVLYFLAAVFLVVAYLREEVRPGLPQAGQVLPDELHFRHEGLVVGAALLLFSFLTFGIPVIQQHDFNLLNTSLWLAGLGYLIWGLMLPRGFSVSKGLAGLRQLVTQPSWRISIGRWGLLLLATSAIVLFFRFYRLDSVPVEMVSDHAEKLLDVNDVLNGNLHVFFPRNTGREAFQFYWTALMDIVFGTGITYMSLKLGTVLGGLVTLYYMYRLGVEIGNRWVGLFALLFTGFGYWPNIISRIGLRFPLYPLFVAPLLFYMIRGLRNANRNDFIKAGLWLGVGLHGYTAYRIVPFLVVVGFLIYLFHEQSPAIRKRVALGLILLAVVSFAVFLPLGRYALDDWDMFAQRSLTRLGETERPLPGPIYQIFFGNVWNAITMFFYQNGDVWVHSIPGRPAMDVISAALFFLGSGLALVRYIRRRHWLDLFLLVSIPLLLLPSILSLAFPNENPNLNRTAGAYVPAFLLLAVGLDALLKGVRANLPGRLGTGLAAILALMLLSSSAAVNYDLVFVQYDRQFRASAWNTSEMGAVMRAFDQSAGDGENNAWVLAFPYWVDTRLVAINAGFTTRDAGLPAERLAETLQIPAAKLFLVNPADQEGLSLLLQLYPDGRYWLYDSDTDGKDFYVFTVPPRENLLPVEPAPAP